MLSLCQAVMIAALATRQQPRDNVGTRPTHAEFPMTTDIEQPSPDAPTVVAPSRLRRELWWSGGGLLFGLILLPMLIYLVGARLLGGYAGGQGLGAFLADFYRSLASGSLAAWSIALGPTALIYAIRYTLIPWPRFARPAPPTADATGDNGEVKREPFVS